MDKTVENPNGKKDLFLSFLDIFFEEIKLRKLEREQHEAAYRSRLQKIFDFHEHQKQKANELQQTLEIILKHMDTLKIIFQHEPSKDTIPFSESLLKPVLTLQSCMKQFVANKSGIENLLASPYDPNVNAMIAKMNADLKAWTVLVNQIGDDSNTAEVCVKALEDIIVSQRNPLLNIASNTGIEAQGSIHKEDKKE